MKIKNAQVKKIGLQKVELSYPAEWEDAFTALCEKATQKHGGYVYAEIKLPRKPRSTGKNSQNNHVFGHARQIAGHMGETVEYVITLACIYAESKGYPCKHPDGNTIPLHHKYASTIEEGYIIEQLHEIAAYLEIVLKEGLEEDDG